MPEITVRAAREIDVPAIKKCVDDAFEKYIERIGKPPAPMLLDYSILNTGINCGFKLELFGSLVRLENDHPTSTYTRDFERNSLSSL